MRLLRFGLVLLLVVIAACTGTKELADAPSTPSDDKEDDSKSYEDVITDEAKTDSGLFVVHRIDDKLLYEIPDEMLGAEMLMVSRTAATANNMGYGGMKANTQVLRWERREDDILFAYRELRKRC